MNKWLIGALALAGLYVISKQGTSKQYTPIFTPDSSPIPNPDTGGYQYGIPQPQVTQPSVSADWRLYSPHLSTYGWNFEVSGPYGTMDYVSKPGLSTNAGIQTQTNLSDLFYGLTGYEWLKYFGY